MEAETYEIQIEIECQRWMVVEWFNDLESAIDWCRVQTYCRRMRVVKKKGVAFAFRCYQEDACRPVYVFPEDGPKVWNWKTEGF
jgi:hypothetical protein